MASPWLSVIMPVHAGAEYLATTLDSVRAARPDGVEFLIYDSSPDTACRDIVARHARSLAIRYKAMPDVRGWPDKTNLGVRDAAASHIAQLHQDDLWLPDHIEAVRESLAQFPDAVMSIAASRIVDRKGRYRGQWSPPLTAGIHSGAAFGRRMLVQNFLAIPSPVIRRSAWLAAGGMDPTLWYTADWDLYLKLARQGDIALRSRTSTAFRIHGQSLTMTGSRDAVALREQLDSVLERHGPAFGLNDDRRLAACARASVNINCSLAIGAAGQRGWIWPTLSSLLSLGPTGALRYVRESRIVDRVLPRLRARMAGAL
jgi:GT2 family glycosyltransferase